jgi:response regulator of citrate/malate metabolism
VQNPCSLVPQPFTEKPNEPRPRRYPPQADRHASQAQLDNIRTAASKEQRGHLAKGIQRQMTELTELSAKADKPQ